MDTRVTELRILKRKRLINAEGHPVNVVVRNDGITFVTICRLPEEGGLKLYHYSAEMGSWYEERPGAEEDDYLPEYEALTVSHTYFWERIVRIGRMSRRK